LRGGVFRQVGAKRPPAFNQHRFHAHGSPPEARMMGFSQPAAQSPNTGPYFLKGVTVPSLPGNATQGHTGDNTGEAG